MGKMVKSLRREFQAALRQKVVSFSALVETMGRDDASGGYDELVRRGSDPLHAVYATTINLVSTFLETSQELAPLQPAVEFIAKMQDLYVPGFPPMSPITSSFFTTWTQFDVRFGRDRETVADCLAGLSDILHIGETQQKALEHLRRSRLGIYQVIGRIEGRYHVRELVTGREVEALIPSGFNGNTGEILLVRLLPPLAGETPYHVAVTTPYVLQGLTLQQWLEYFARHQIVPAAVGLDERLRRHMKAAPAPDYWAEYIFWGYLNYRADAVFLTGFPDRPETQPQHDSYDPSSAQSHASDGCR